MNLAAYLERIGFVAAPRPDLDTLRRIHRGHVLNIPYENLDVQLGKPVSRAAVSIFDKLVIQRRGGWCYEMNGLLCSALEEIGFQVTRMASGVRRAQAGDAMLGNHLVLCVHLDEPYLADTGFGDGLLEPVQLRAGAITQDHSSFTLEDLGDRWWRFHGDPRSSGLSFDFEMKPADENLLDAQCQALQTNPASPFVQNAVVQKPAIGHHASLRGKVLRLAGDGTETRELSSAAEYSEVLKSTFGLTLPDTQTLWNKIEARHRELFPAGMVI